METRHIKIDYESSLASKKHLLSSEMNLLRILKKIKAYGSSRKRELILKNKLRIRLNDLRKSINLTQSFLPVENTEIIKKKRKIIKDIEPNVQSELEEIKKKLDSLGE